MMGARSPAPGSDLDPPRDLPATVSSSPRLSIYAGTGAAALVAALVAGRPALAAFGTPLLLLALAGVGLARRPTLLIGPAALSPSLAVVDDPLRLEVEVATQPPAGRLDVVVDTSGPVTVRDRPSPGPPGWTVVDGEARRLRTDLDTIAWGRVSTSAATVRAYGPLGLIRWTWRVPTPSAARVLPRPAPAAHADGPATPGDRRDACQPRHGAAGSTSPSSARSLQGTAWPT